MRGSSSGGGRPWGSEQDLKGMPPKRGSPERGMMRTRSLGKESLLGTYFGSEEMWTSYWKYWPPHQKTITLALASLLLLSLGLSYGRTFRSMPQMEKSAPSDPGVRFLSGLVGERYRARGLQGANFGGGAFQASPQCYAEAVKELKIYVYALPRQFNQGLLEEDPRCAATMFAPEVHIHRALLDSAVRTLDPSEADFFFVPVYSSCFLDPAGFVKLGFSGPLIKRAVKLIATDHPFWNRTQGADHIFVTPHDHGACFDFRPVQARAKGVLYPLQRSILLQTFGHQNHVCHLPRSVVIPPFVVAGPDEESDVSSEYVSDSGDAKRSTVAFFRGALDYTMEMAANQVYSGGVRQALAQFQERPGFDINGPKMTAKESYEAMKRSLFCLAPRGWVPLSGTRVPAAMAHGCVPVIIGNEAVMPFTHLLSWQKIAVLVSEEQVHELENVLRSLTDEEVRLRQERLRTEVRKALLYLQPPAKGDAFDNILGALARLKLQDAAIARHERFDDPCAL